MIVAEHLSKNFGAIRAVDDISFSVEQGQNFVFLGTSGCGKTTTLRMINRLIEPSSGNITVNGESVMSQQPEKLRRSIGYVLQHNGLFPHYSVAENIAIVPRLLRMEESRIRKRTVELMEKLHLSPGKYMDAYPHELSGGQQQRVGIARALAADPPVLLMDEPFGALDTITRTSIRKELSELDEFKVKTILMVTHDVQEAFAFADQLCLMNKGKIMQMGTPAELVFRPRGEFVSDFLKEEKTQLAFRTVRMADLWGYLPPAKPGAFLEAVADNVTAWELLERFYAQAAPGNLRFLVTNSREEKKEVAPAELMAALTRLKSKTDE
jgi:osmoprotectant transport system ATP-binding protein